jgi:hypothetical protein
VRGDAAELSTPGQVEVTGPGLGSDVHASGARDRPWSVVTKWVRAKDPNLLAVKRGSSEMSGV